MINFDGLDLPQLEALKVELQEQKQANHEAINTIKDQLDQAMADVHGGSDYDWQWWRRAKTALRYKGQNDQRLVRELVRVNKRIKALRYAAAVREENARRESKALRHTDTVRHNAARKATFYSAFFQEARVRLPDETFRELCESAGRIAEEAEE